MVLGLNSKKKGSSVYIDYTVTVLEIKPWPPSPSLQSVQSVWLQWKNGEKSSGKLITVAGETGIVFNESFLLPVTLRADKKSQDKYKKNNLEFSLLEPRRDKDLGYKEPKLLGTAVLDVSEYGIIKDVTVAVPMNCKKSSKSGPLPDLYVRIEASNSGSFRSSSTTVRSSRTSLDEESLNGSEIASFTDDEASFHSPGLSARASPSRSDENGGETPKMDDQESSFRGSSLLPPFRSRSVHEEPLEISSPIIGHVDVNEKADILKKNPSERRSSPKMVDQESSFRGSSLLPPLRSKSVREEPLEISSPIMGRVDVSERQSSEHEASILRLGNLLQMDGRKEDQSSPYGPRGGGIRRAGTMNSTTDAKKTPGAETGRLKHVKSQLSGLLRAGSESDLATEADIIRNVGNRPKISKPLENRLPKGNGSTTPLFTTAASSDDPRVQILEDELKETATLEIAIYSVVAEHVSSRNKVLAPARRLSRSYLHACKENSGTKIANAARAAVSGLIIVSKACGNDVPRLTFWLSNVIMLRVIVSQSATKIRSMARRYDASEEADEWGEIGTFNFALEKIESWIFSRIVDSVWWQALTPNMQPSAANKVKGTSTKKIIGSKSGLLANQEQGNFSIELWKKAFKDACERLCPTRAGKLECGCLPVIATLVMEQLVIRLDMAMFNAILRESSAEMPSDPKSDPISDPRVLPIQAGKLSFGAGVQLKNAVGSWSRWLSDLYWVEDGGDKKNSQAAKPFRFLNALSDLMKLPLDVLTDVKTRKEYCPLLGPTLIKKALLLYVPDEFCPKPIPRSLIKALDSEVGSDEFADSVSAPEPVYSPPPETLLASFMKEDGKERSAVSYLRKLHTSDDELDELNSPLTSVLKARFGGGKVKVSRYRLLSDVWKDYEQ